MSFSRSITSNDRSGRTRTTIMCSEFVPISMAAMRIGPSYYNGAFGRAALVTMPASTQRYDLLHKRLDRFTQMLQGLDEGDVRALHQTRVASRRLREILPVLQVDPEVASRLGRRLRKVTQRLGAVRELDVLSLLIEELSASGRYDQQAMQARRGVCRRGPEARARPSARETSRRRTAPHRRQAWPHRRRSEDEQEDRPRLALGGRRARDAPGARAQDSAGRGWCTLPARAAARWCASRSRSCGMRTKWPPRPVGST